MALMKRGAREMDFTGRPLKGMVYVDGDELEASAALGTWIQRGVDFVMTRSPK